MPLTRYFLFVGGVLLALLLAIDWYTPQSVAEAGRSDVDRSTIRIHSSHKWPSAVSFDTTQPIIVPVALPAMTEPVPAAAAPPAAIAVVQQAEPELRQAAPAVAPKRPVRRTKVARTRAPAPRVASYDSFGFRNAFAFGW